MSTSEWSSSEWTLSTHPPAPPPTTVFATLTPANDAAWNAFDCVVAGIEGKGTGHRCEGAGKFMVIDGERMARGQEGVGNGVGKGDENGSANGSVRGGWYVFDFEVAPRSVERGWVVGSGDFNSTEDDRPDILLTDEKHSNGIHRHHASLAHNYTSGALLLTALSSPITLDGIETLKPHQRRLVHKQKTSIHFGNQQYILSLSPLNSQQYRTLLTNYTTTHSLHPTTYPPNLMLSPSPYDRLLPPSYILKNPIGHGITGIVSAALHLTTGNCFAIKTLRRYTDADVTRLEKEQKISSTIGPHPNICQLISIIAPDIEDKERGCKARGGVDEAFIIYEPLASWTVERLVDTDTYVPEPVCVGLLREWVDGLAFLHGKGIMHRDVKPGNLTVLSMKPPRAQLIDFGHAIEARLASNEDVGTKGWRAPELAALATSTGRRAWYDERIDVFSLGISWYMIFCRVGGCWWSGREVREKDLGRMGKEMGKRVGDGEGAVQLVVRCLDWEPRMRPRSEEVKQELRTLCEGGGGRGKDGGGGGGWGEEEGGDGFGGKEDKKGRRGAWR